MARVSWEKFNRSDTLGLIGLVVGFFLYTFVPSVWLKGACLFLGVGTLYPIFLHSEPTRTWSKSWRLLAALAISVSALGIAIPQLISQWHDEHTPREPSIVQTNVPEAKPHLSAGLVIGLVGNTNTAMRILLENDGSVPINNMLSYVRSDDVLDASFFVPNSTALDVHDKTEISIDTYAAEKPHKVELYLTYYDSLGPGYSLFTFIVPALIAGSQPILPRYTKQSKGRIQEAVSEQALQDTSAQFLNKTGTILLTFPSSTATTGRSTLYLHAPHRLFMIDAVKHKVAVYGEYSSGRKVREGFIPATPNIATVAVAWNDDTQLLKLYINGKLVTN